MDKKFSTYLNLLLLVFVGVPLILAAGTFYVVLSKSLTQEYWSKLQTKQVTESKELKLRFNELKMMVQSISDNNAIKINLMLGIRSKVESVLKKEYGSKNGALFFISNADNTIIPELPYYLRDLYPHVSKLSGKKSVMFQNVGQNTFYSLFGLPIIKKDGRLLGKAFVVYDLSKDIRFWNRFGTGTNDTLFIQNDHNIVNLRTNQITAIPSEIPNIGAKELESILSDLFPDNRVTLLDDFPGLYYVASLKSLVEQKMFWLFVLGIICLAIFILTIGVALVIARNVSRPLAGIANQATMIANEPSDVLLSQEGVKYHEFYMLIQSFNGLLCALAQAKEKRLEQLMKYRNILESMMEGYYELDLNGNFSFFNDSTLTILERPKDELMSMNYQELTDKETAKQVYQQFNKVIKTGTKEKGFIWVLIRKDGTKKYVEISISLMNDLEGQPIGFRGVLRDVTERKNAEKERRKLESKLQQSQKMEAIGTLAGGVAHDLNNVLSGIVAYPELLLMDMSEDNPYREYILRIQNSGKKAAAIVQDLLTMARRGVAVNDVVNLDNIIREYLMSPEYEGLKSHHPQVQVETNLERDLLNILGSSVHLSKTIMNLVSNAAEAMPHGGTVFISTENIYIDRPVGGYDNVEEGDYVTVAVADTGMGIPKKDIEMIFEPFYTKKVMGKSGTGLGMAVVWGTVKDHKGYIDVQSAEGKGTTFTLYFPVTRKEISGKEKALPMEEYIGKGESILVVDDVEDQREIASRILNKLGYSVTSVSSGEEAVDYMKDNSADLLVLDMIMDPGIGGLETYKKILELHPGQKAIIASGFSETDHVKEAQRLGAGKYIKKPYTLEKIGLAVKEELEK